MHDNPTISVIMSVYNGKEYLRESIESILNQTFTDFEFIIIDDGSTDNSLKIIQKFNDTRIRIIENKNNIGLTKSLNKALQQATGKYIARQDADDISLPNRFKEQVNYLNNHPEIVLLGTNIYLIDENSKIIGKRITSEKPNINKLKKKNQFTHGSVMYKNEIISQLGGYNELFKYSQDYELWLRITKYHNVRNLTQLLYKSRLHDANTRFINIEGSTLYHFLVQRSFKGELNKELLKCIGHEGIKCTFTHLNKKEKIILYEELAKKQEYIGNLTLAREEYKKIFILNPFIIKNDIKIILSYLGNDMIWRTKKINRNLLNFLHHIKYHWLMQ